MLTNFLSENFRLKKDQIFDGLSPEELNILTGAGVTHTYKRGEIIFREGGIPVGIFYIKKGRVKKYKATMKGGEQIFYVCGEGELLGYHALLSEGFYPDAAACLEDSQITFIPKESFMKVLRNSPVLSNRLLKALGHEFTWFINAITNLATRTVRERLAFNLLILEERFKTNGSLNHQIDINMSRSDLANIVGTAKETLVRILQELKRDHLIETTGRTVTIINRKGIINEANLVFKNLK
jgi:CRP-like cAMP-binding protein